MKINEIASVAPVGPHIEGLIRFSRDSGNQSGEFELLSHLHDGSPMPGEVPAMLTHPMSDSMMATDGKDEKRRLLTEVPIMLMFDKPENNLSAKYTAYQRSTGALLCSGDGENASRRTSPGSTPSPVQCTGPEACPFANGQGIACQLQVRLKVQVEGSEDPFAVFEFQSSGVNSYRTLAAKLKMMHALYGYLRGLPLRLTSWSKSTRGSDYLPFYCANLELAEGMSIVEAKVKMAAHREATEGLDFDAMETAVEAMEASSPFVLDGTESVVTSWSAVAATIDTQNSGQPYHDESSQTQSIMSSTIALALAQQQRVVSTQSADEPETVCASPDAALPPTPSHLIHVKEHVEAPTTPPTQSAVGATDSAPETYEIQSL